MLTTVHGCLVARVIGPYDQVSSMQERINQRMVAEGLRARADGTAAGVCRPVA